VISLSGWCLWYLKDHVVIAVSTLFLIFYASPGVRHLYAFPFSRCSASAFNIYLSLSIMHGPRFLSVMNMKMMNMRSSVRGFSIRCSFGVRLDVGVVLLFCNSDLKTFWVEAIDSNNFSQVYIFIY